MPAIESSAEPPAGRRPQTQPPSQSPTQYRQSPSHTRASGGGVLASETYWFAGAPQPKIGSGTVGLYANEAQQPLLYGNAALRARRAADYAAWREQHSDLFQTMRGGDATERVAERQRHQREELRRRARRDEAYAEEIGRLRRRGWSVLADDPRPESAARYAAQRQQRLAAQAERASGDTQRAHVGTELRAEIARLMETRRAREAARKDAANRAAQAERTAPRLGETRRLHLAQMRAAAVRAESEALCGAAAAEREREAAELRESHASALANTHGSSSASLGRSGTTRAETLPLFRSPLPPLPNAGDEAYRRQWLSDLKASRVDTARAEVAHVHLWEQAVEAARDGTLRENYVRAGGLRAESDALRARREELEEADAAVKCAIRIEEMQGRQRRQDMANTLREERRHHAAEQRKAMVEEEALAKTCGEAELEQLRERVARMRPQRDRNGSPKPEATS